MLSTNMQEHGHFYIPDVHVQMPVCGKAGAIQAFPLPGSRFMSTGANQHSMPSGVCKSCLACT